MTQTFSTQLKWAKFILFLAAAYNLIWGGMIALFPEKILFGEAPSFYLLMMIRCIAMLVGVYGIAYYIASKNPPQYAALIWVGLIGKILGPLGAFYYVFQQQLNPDFLWVNVGNDLIWWLPFSWVLYQCMKGKLNLPCKLSSLSLYQQHLGEEYEKMSLNLQHFHKAKSTIRVLGTFKVERGTNFITKMMAKIADLPAETLSEEAELIVFPHQDKEVWSRRIGNKKVISSQWLEGGYLVERFMIIQIYLFGKVENGNLIIQEASTTILGIPMPPFFTPVVYATGQDRGEGVEVTVDIGFKPFGRIIKYSGIVNFAPIV